MKYRYFYLFVIFTLISCTQKIYFFDAQKLSKNQNGDADTIEVDSYFAGDALDYVVFEIDITNKSKQNIELSYRNVYLEIQETGTGRPIVLSALNKEAVISELQERHEQLRREKKTRDIVNAVDIGVNLLLIGSSGGYNTTNAILYSTDVASYMIEDARSHKLLTGSIEEQIAYVEDWVLDEATLTSSETGTWDVLFARRLYDADAKLVIEIDGKSYTQDFDLNIIEEKVRN